MKGKAPKRNDSARGKPAAERRRQLLVVEDDPGLQRQLKWVFDDYEVLLAEDRASAIAQVRRHQPPVVTLDLGLPPDPANAAEGLATLQELLALAPHAKIVVVTGNDDRENALRSISLGAYDFYQKPVDPDVLSLIVSRAHTLHSLEEENRRLQGANAASPLEGVIGASPQMGEVCRIIEKVAPTDVSVLLLGESGTGKEVLTRALHRLSNRKGEPLVVINCAAIPETLLESELFGYEKGAFTGANKQTLGKIETADGGTLFLDEIGDLPHSLQAKLLRFLQERVIERVGGRHEIPVDVRVVCATHQDLAAKITTSEFREDLYYRISEVTVEIPPLREREGDALLLANVLLTRYAGEHAKSIRGFSDEAAGAVQAHQWPGNVRELENRIKRAAIMAEGTVVGADDLQLAAKDGEPMPVSLRDVRERAERSAIQRALLLCDGRVSSTAEALGVSRPTLYDLMEKYGMK